LEIGQGQPCERLSALPRSFAEAAQLLHARSEQEIQRHEARVTQHALLLHKAMEYIDAHSANPDLSLGLVAAVVGLSPSYFSAVFARELGQTFVEHLTNVRIQKAMQLLRTSPLSAAEIGYQVGYSNPRYFYSVFKKVAGQPPNEYKRQALG
jgi:two-component system response regulator YesN